MENHKDCKEVTVLENIIKNIKTSNLFNEIEQLIDELIETIGKIRQNRETNVSAVKEQKILVQNETRAGTEDKNRQTSWQVIRKFDEGIDWKKNGITVETRELLVSLDEKQKELVEHQTNIVNIEKYVSDLQTYLAVKEIEKDVETQDTCLHSIVNSDSLN